MANVTLRLPAGRSERLLHHFDAVLDRIEMAVLTLFTEQPADFREATQMTRLRRSASRGCGGQAI